MAPALPTFDAPLAATLLSAVLRLADLAAAPTAPDSAPDSDTGTDTKLELSKQAAALHATLARLATQAAALPAGQLSIEDQRWLIGELEGEVARQRNELGRMAQLTELAKDGAGGRMDDGDVKMDEAA